MSLVGDVPPRKSAKKSVERVERGRRFLGISNLFNGSTKTLLCQVARLLQSSRLVVRCGDSMARAIQRWRAARYLHYSFFIIFSQKIAINFFIFVWFDMDRAAFLR